jgi:molybdopterin molybdotransferase
MIAPSEALAKLLAAAEPVAERDIVKLADAAGRTLAADVFATRDQPPFPASAMDGYAVRADDLVSENALRIVGRSLAGTAFVGTIGRGEAVRIFTGGPIPSGADTILIQENARLIDEDRVMPLQHEPVGRFVRPAGLDFHRGDCLLQSGLILEPRHLGLAASAGCATVEVARRPVVALLATGDELVMPGEAPGASQIFLSNSFHVAALVRKAGCVVSDLGIVPDDREQTRLAIERAAADSDVIVTTGGASVGDHDHVHAALGDAGFAITFWRIALRPGKPFMVGQRGRTLLLGLPGNPVSSAVCAILFLLPLLRRMLGQPSTGPVRQVARTGTALPANDAREEYMRCTLTEASDGAMIATPFQNQDSSLQRVFAAADALLVRPAHAAAVRAGEPCEIIRL